MENLFLSLLNISVTASWIVLAVILLRILLKNAPKWIRVLWWGIVGIRLAVPFSFESILSLIPRKTYISPEIMYSEAPTISTGFPALNSVINPVISENLAPNLGNSVNPMQVIVAIASYLWVIGLIALILYSLVSFFLLKRRLKEAVKEEEKIYLSEYVESPFILGIIKPKIYLPFNLSGSEKEYIIAHEKAHIKRRDYLLKPLAFLLLSVYWFNPILWVAYILLCRDIELSADERATKAFDKENRQEYSKTLLKNSIQKRKISACPLAFGETGVKGRIKAVMSYKKPAFWLVIIAVVSLIAAAACLLTDPITDGNSDFDTDKIESNDNIVVAVSEDKWLFNPALSATWYAWLEIDLDFDYDRLEHEIHGGENADVKYLFGEDKDNIKWSPSQDENGEFTNSAVIQIKAYRDEKVIFDEKIYIQRDGEPEYLYSVKLASQDYYFDSVYSQKRNGVIKIKKFLE